MRRDYCGTMYWGSAINSGLLCALDEQRTDSMSGTAHQRPEWLSSVRLLTGRRVATISDRF